MKHLFKPQVFKAIAAILALLLGVKILWLIVQMLWLPTNGIDHVKEKGNKALYYRVKLTPNEAAAPVIRPTKKRPSQSTSGSIKDIKLLAIYNASDMTVVTVEHKSKTKVLSRGDDINGFVLEGAGNNFAKFSKNAKTYKVLLLKGKSPSSSSVKPVKAPPGSKRKTTPKEIQGNVTDAGDRKIIDRSLLDHYAKNMDDMLKNIGVKEVRNGANIEGFQITFVRKGSHFAKLGVRRNDVIKSINGQEINSYNAALGIYKDIGNLENLTLVIQRGKEEMELEYEIN